MTAWTRTEARSLSGGFALTEAEAKRGLAKDQLWAFCFGGLVDFPTATPSSRDGRRRCGLRDAIHFHQ